MLINLNREQPCIRANRERNDVASASPAATGR